MAAQKSKATIFGIIILSIIACCIVAAIVLVIVIAIDRNEKTRPARTTFSIYMINGNIGEKEYCTYRASYDGYTIVFTDKAGAFKIGDTVVVAKVPDEK